MATVYRKTYTKPLPADAEEFIQKGERWARWVDSKGKCRKARITAGQDGTKRITVVAGTYTAKFRNGKGIVCEVATGCRSKDSAISVLKELTNRAERVKANILTADEDAVSTHQKSPLAEQFAAFKDRQVAKGNAPRRIKDMQAHLCRVSDQCGFRNLGDLRGDALENWLASQQEMSAATRNEYRATWIGFANWCVKNRRLLANPFADVPRADVNADRRRLRRALTEDELTRLLEFALSRPLKEAMTVRRGKQKGKQVANVREEVRERLIATGRERALIYKTLVLTGLRRNELATLTVGQLDLDSEVPSLKLDAVDEKNRQGNQMAVRRDLADDLRLWLVDALHLVQRNARGRGEPVPTRLPSDRLLFNLPSGLLRILDRDLRAAGIPKQDERGRTVDLHALRHTFGTHLSKGGVSPRTAQQAMRHSRIDLTMQVYTDPKLLDVAGALDVLPSLPLNGCRKRAEPDSVSVPVPARSGCALAPTLAPNPVQSGESLSIVDKIARPSPDVFQSGENELSPCPVQRKRPQSIADYGRQAVGGIGLEPTTSTMSTCGSTDTSATVKGVTTTQTSSCTAACTKSENGGGGIDLETLAAALRRLSPSERTQLTSLLRGESGN